MEKGAQVNKQDCSAVSAPLSWYAARSESCVILQARQVSSQVELIQKPLLLHIPSLCADGCRRVRFNRPYIHTMVQPCATLTLKQSKFDAEGFASTGIRPQPCSGYGPASKAYINDGAAVLSCHLVFGCL